MRIRYFSSTDTLFIEFRDAAVAETRDLDENTVLDLDSERAKVLARALRCHPAVLVFPGWEWPVESAA